MTLPRALIASLAAAGSAAVTIAGAQVLLGDPAQCAATPATVTPATAIVTNINQTPNAEWLTKAAPWLHAAQPAPNVCGPCGRG